MSTEALQNAHKAVVDLMASGGDGPPVSACYIDSESGSLVVGLEEGARDRLGEHEAALKKVAPSVPVSARIVRVVRDDAPRKDGDVRPLWGGVVMNSTATLCLVVPGPDGKMGTILSSHEVGNGTGQSVGQAAKASSYGKVTVNPSLKDRYSDSAFAEITNNRIQGEANRIWRAPNAAYVVLDKVISANTPAYMVLYMQGAQTPDEQRGTLGWKGEKYVTVRDSRGVLRNQVMATYKAQSGDSGAPIYYFPNPSDKNNVFFIGIHAGRIIEDGSEIAYYSPWESIKSELGLPLPARPGARGGPVVAWPPAMSNEYLERILKARVYDVAIESPLEPAPRLSRRLGNEVFFKREDLQPVFSFKLRGACNKIAHTPDEVARCGVICASAGNHAQGVALAARRRGVPATVVMPETTPAIKVGAVRDLGGEVVLRGDDYDQAYEHALALSKERGLAFLHPFDDPDVIAGQGTIGMEILRQHPGESLHAVFAAVGGGGLVAGVAAYVKALFPKVRVVGVEPEDADAMYQSLREGRRVRLERAGHFADGAAVRRVGEETFRLCRLYLDEVIRVSNDEICAAIQDVFEDNRSILEPAGALGVAGLKRYVEREGARGLSLVAVNSGANVNFDRLRHVAERADVGGLREALFAAEIPEQKGSFLRFCELLGGRPVTEFNYRYHDGEAAQVFVGLALSGGRAERDGALRSIAAGGYAVTDMSDDEMAKLHVRYMVGGRARGLCDERLFRFEFPERPGALLRFLRAIGIRWNISLFHYRNHGSDCGRVLAGVQVPPDEAGDFDAHVRELNYPCVEETENPAYRMFLGT